MTTIKHLKIIKGTQKGTPRAQEQELKNLRSNTGRSKKQTDPRVKEFLNWWKEVHQERIGIPYHCNYGKDGDAAKRLLETYDLPTLQSYAKDFFRDEQGQRLGFTIGVFSQAVNRIAEQKAMNPLEQAKREMRWK